MKFSFLLPLSIFSSLLPTLSSAADTRHVVEPNYPATCSVIYARNNLITADIQSALNKCGPGKAVQLSSNGSMNTFLSGALNMPSGVSLLIDKGVTLKAINNASAFDNGKKTCGTINGDGKGCNALITFNNSNNAGIYGEGTIDGQGSAVLNDKMTSWWDLAQKAKAGGNQNAPRLIQINNSQNITLYKITLKNSPNFHVVFYKSNGLTVWDTTINTPANARNTDGIDPISSRNVTVAYSNISTGDDNIAIKANPNSGSSRDMSFIQNNFGSGHGLSIGSETIDGVYNIDVNGLIMSGTDNGLRIKSDKSASGEVAAVNYNHVTMSNVKNAIMMDTIYENKSGSTKANWHDITYNDITVKGNSTIIFNGTNAAKPLQATMIDMHLPTNITWKVINANIKK
ncbi:glycoside hydrolase family 28 protein [Acinetobacter pollinis]|uniref:glycoside hydrolase family 28 protein n=2 Tax=Acinetobacter pollinis TaxID=2605270 RepID=UPI0018A30194|nr:glycosyl hydrolase family 28 protein [Acinetobacter pollinis]MBF7699067.1 endopolygalacturonase [Acinetobacter pollinis]